MVLKIDPFFFFFKKENRSLRSTLNKCRKKGDTLQNVLIRARIIWTLYLLLCTQKKTLITSRWVRAYRSKNETTAVVKTSFQLYWQNNTFYWTLLNIGWVSWVIMSGQKFVEYVILCDRVKHQRVRDIFVFAWLSSPLRVCGQIQSWTFVDSWCPRVPAEQIAQLAQQRSGTRSSFAFVCEVPR